MILSVTTAIGSTRIVRETPFGLVDCTGAVLGRDALPLMHSRPATPDESTAFRRFVHTAHLADIAEHRGAPAVARLAATEADPDETLCDVADELRRRGKDGKASQVLAFRWAADEVQPATAGGWG